jgi:hypothetical protein
MTRSILSVPVLLCLATVPALADEVLYCTDTDVAGFAWDKNGGASIHRFNAKRYTVKLEPATDYGLKQVRVITRSDEGRPERYKCESNLLLGDWDKTTHLPDSSTSPLTCEDQTGTQPWEFFPDNSYRHAFLHGGPDRDPNIWIAYGTCTRF